MKLSEVMAQNKPLKLSEVMAQQEQPETPVQESNQSVLPEEGPVNTAGDSIPGWMKPIAEMAAAANKSVFEFMDFLGPNNINAVMQLAGSDKRVPTLTESFGSDGNYMKEGLGRNIAKGIGSTVPMAVAAGSALRQGAAALPKLAPGESAGSGVLRQMAQTTAKQDATAGALAATGGEIGAEVGGEDGRLIGSVVAPMAMALPSLAGEAVKGGARGFNKNNKEVIKRAVNDFAEIDSTPSLGQATGDSLREGIETRSGQVFGGGAIRKSIDRTINNMQKRLQNIADDISRTGGDVETGRVIQKGITGDDGFVSRFQEKSGSLWSAVDSKIPENATTNVENTKAALYDMTRGDAFGRVLNNSKLVQVKGVLDDILGQPKTNHLSMVTERVKKIPYRDLVSLRRHIGEMLGSKDLVSDVPRGQLKRLYAALSEDTKQVAESYGAIGPFVRANKYTSAGHKRLGDFVERIATKVDLDKVFAAMAKGGEGIQALNAMKRSLKPNEWEAVSANVIRQLGKATNANQDMAGEVFSVNKFLTDWNKLGKSKSVLFSGSKKLNEYSKNLDKIARVAERVKQAGSEGANASGTGQMLANSGIGAGIVGGVATGNLWAAGGLIAAVGANKMASELMTSPKFINWLAQSSTVKDLPKHIAKLEFIGNAEGLSEPIADLLASLKEGADIDSANNQQ